MDAQTVAQTVAQAVQAATQQQQQQQQAAQQQQAQSPAPTHSVSSAPTSAIDNLTCQWQGCGERTDNAEALYDHVCERHVGRKSTNNLNLTCQWGACRTTTVKRDHITSHIRVHVPLKPHKCDFCGKAFKRPQDLKKHVKTHADDSVLMNSPQPGANRSVNGVNGGLGQQNGKPSNYYGGHDSGMTPYPAYGHGIAAGNGGGHFQPQGHQYAGYGAVSYPNSAVSDLQSMDTRRRAIEALNDFLGDIKRRAIDPSAYYDVGQRLQTNSLPLPVASGNGYNTGYNNQTTSYGGFNTASLIDAFSGGCGGGGGGGNNMSGGNTHSGPISQHGYSLPIPNARSKNDLQDIDRFLEQLQATVYETSNSAAAAGVHHPGVHSQFTGDFGFGNNNNNNNNSAQFRSSESPPNMSYTGSGAASAAMSSIGTSMPGLTSSASALDTPALTPASVSSYSSSGHSPMSSHGGRSSLGSLSGNNLYPSLPSVTGISDLGSGYPTTTSAPASGLASGYDGMDGRRYSGGRLQRQAPVQDTEMADAPLSDGARTPKQSDAARPAKSKGNSSIDPALRGEDEKSPSSEDAAGTPTAASAESDEKQEQWIENIRVIESLRKWIAEKLQAGDFEDEERSPVQEGGAEQVHHMATSSSEDAKLSPAGTVEAEGEAHDVSYPALASN